MNNPITVLLTAMLLISINAFADIYKHVDKDGRIQYSNKKPDNSWARLELDANLNPVATTKFEPTVETVYVKYRGPVNLAPFKCEWISRSSVVNRLCYDSKEQYVIVKLKETYYHYCEMPADIVTDWRDADSMGRYYNAQVKGRYDCRILRVPSYKN